MDTLSNLLAWLSSQVPIDGVLTMLGFFAFSEALRTRYVMDKLDGPFEKILQALLRILARRPKIYRAPGTRLERVLKFVFRKKTFDALYGQTIADAREEYNQALLENRIWEARWIAGCLYVNVLKVLIVGFGVGLAKKAVEIWKIGS